MTGAFEYECRESIIVFFLVVHQRNWRRKEISREMQGWCFIGWQRHQRRQPTRQPARLPLLTAHQTGGLCTPAPLAKLGLRKTKCATVAENIKNIYMPAPLLYFDWGVRSLIFCNFKRVSLSHVIFGYDADGILQIIVLHWLQQRCSKNTQA